MIGLQEKLQRYAWCKQVNQKYSIFHVPIFSTYEKEGITKKTLEEIIKNFSRDLEKFYWPPIHIGHHEEESSEEKEVVGFLDNFAVEEGGGTIYADFVEVSKETFRKIQDLKLPSRSVEYIPSTKTIATVALLQTRKPAHIFPILALEESESAQNSVQKYSEQLRSKILTFSKEGIKKMSKIIEEPKKFEKPEKPEKPDEISEKFSEEDITKPVSEDRFGRLEVKIAAIYELILEMLKMKTPDSLESNAPGVKNPSSISYEDSVLKKISLSLEHLSGRIDAVEKQDSVKSGERRLQGICAKNKALNFSTALKTMLKFSDTTSQNVFLDSLEAEAPIWDTHPAGRIPRDIDTAKDEITLKKYNSSTPLVRALAEKALDIHNATIQAGGRLADVHKQNYSTPEKFVCHIVEMEKITPGYLGKLTGK